VTVDFKLPQPAPAFEAALVQVSPIPKHIFENEADMCCFSCFSQYPLHSQKCASESGIPVPGPPQKLGLDGEKLTADDVVFTINKILDEKQHSFLRSNFMVNGAASKAGAG
jgi:hypothetical protein